MFQRRISVADVRRAIERGDVIGTRPDDLPYPRRLVLDWSIGRALPVVVAENRADDEMIVITVYEPDPTLCEPGFRRRRKA
jgi:hypothetical protein